MGSVDPDRSSLANTIVREVQEETTVPISVDHCPPTILAVELAEGFIQQVFLGFKISARTNDRIAGDRYAGNWEGRPFIVSFDKLPSVLNSAKLVPSGKAHLLAWLAIGAPNAGSNPQFGSYSPAQLFDFFVA